MSIGSRRNRITFEVESTVTNDSGFQETTWQPIKTVWASMNNLFGREFWSAKGVQQENTIVFTVRYNRMIEELDTKKTRINLRGKHFKINHIDNVRYENKDIMIKAIELV